MLLSPIAITYQEGNGIIEMYACYSSPQCSVSSNLQEVRFNNDEEDAFFKKLAGQEPMKIIMLLSKMQVDYLCHTDNN